MQEVYFPRRRANAYMNNEINSTANLISAIETASNRVLGNILDAFFVTPINPYAYLSEVLCEKRILV
jgi:hypothetical protein